VSTILDALRKLQRERAAQSPAKDLRGSVTHESAPGRARRRGSGPRRIAALLALLAVGGGGYLLYASGQVPALLARFQSEDENAMPDEQALAELDAASARVPEVPEPEQVAPAPAPTPPARAARPARTRPTTPPGGAPFSPENPDIAAERARLEAALANARAAQEARRQAELAAAAQQEAMAQEAVPQRPLEPESAGAPPAATVPAPAATMPAKSQVATQKPPPAAKPEATVVAAKPKPARKAEAPAPRPSSSSASEPAASASAFPWVRVESIRWHPVSERRVASLVFERQNAPEAREGDIVAGVLVFRIDPGSVELRVGGVQRTVLPGP
jgi:cytoskeletal protein RodZ